MRALVSGLCLALAGTVLSAQDPPSLPVLTARAGTYVARFAGRLSGMVVEESYVQDLPQVARMGFRAALPRGPIHRTLKSDLLLVRPEGSEAWMQFRDVFEVDGKPVRDRNDRLAKIFLQPSKTTAQQADRIVRESARYNIGDIERTINLPLFGLSVLDRMMQASFQFVLGDGPDVPNGVMALPKQLPDFQPPDGTIVLSYAETALQTIVRTPQGRNLPARGRFWLRPESGEVLMTELRVDDWNLRAVVHVSYRDHADIGLPVPVAMHEAYENRTNGSRVEGLATYSNFREFSVKVDEQIAPVK